MTFLFDNIVPSEQHVIVLNIPTYTFSEGGKFSTYLAFRYSYKTADANKLNADLDEDAVYLCGN